MNKNLFSIFSIFIIFILFSLGGWQLVRLQWKKDLIKDINLSISQPAKSLITENIKNYQKVKSQGILFKNNYFVYRLNEKGKYGFNLVSILKLNTSDAVIIQRGWVEKIEKSMLEKAARDSALYLTKLDIIQWVEVLTSMLIIA